MILNIHINPETETKRNKYWRKYGKVRKKRALLEFIHEFDERVYKLGLKALKKK